MIEILLAAVLATQVPARFTVEASSATQPQGVTFRAGYAISGARDRSVEFYTRDGAAEYVLRRSELTVDGGEQVEWASSTTCPVILSLVLAMQRLALGQLSIPGLLSEPEPRFVFPMPPMPATDTSSYTVWGWGRQPDAAAAAYRISANSGTIAAFVQQADVALNPCWSTDNAD